MKKIIQLMLVAMASVSLSAEQKPNVLFIAIDDLNDWVGCLGNSQAITPNIDRLAKEGMLFRNAHCQAPICGPSRASVMTGLAPTTTGMYLMIPDEKIKEAGDAASKAVFMNDWFEQQGYKTMGAGKIYHLGDQAKTFDEYVNTGGFPKPKKRLKWPPAAGWPVTEGTSTDWGPFGDRDEDTKDFKTAAFAVQRLKQKQDKPFFLAAGFSKPHVPWYLPKKWFDMYPLESIQTPPYKADDLDDVPELARQLMDMPMMPPTEWLIKNHEWKNMLQAYLACVTYVDAQVGKVLDALAESDYADNTVVVLWSDHGYHLGEKGRTCKQSTWERSARTILLFKAPGKMPGQTCDAPVQLLDIYPTLTDLCGIPANEQCEGHSLVPLLDNPQAQWDHLAFTAYGPGNLSMRSRTHRYILYEDGSEELYDMVKDPNEWTNLASNPEYNQLKAYFKKNAPTVQVPMSPMSGYWANKYLRKKTNKTWGKGWE